MIQYDKNTQIVIQTLQSYGYSARAVRLTDECFTQLRLWLMEHDMQEFSGSAALNWAKTEKAVNWENKTYPVAVQRLWDVYEHGEVLRTHIFFYGRSLPESFLKAKKGYVTSQDGTMAGRTLGNLSDCCNRFLGFLCINGICSPAEISYHILDRYMLDISQTMRTPCTAEGFVEGLLFYMAGLGQCSYGLGWYVHFARHGKVPVGDDFSLACVTSPEAHNGHDAAFVLHSIPAFLDILKGYRYSRPVISTSHDVLTLLYVLLDMSGICYTRTVAEAWINAAGERLFKSSFVMARRALELYDDFLSTGKVDPFKRWKHRTSDLELLPEWCQEPIRQFMEHKQREGRSKKTVANYGFSATKFCLFLLKREISDFGKLTPELIKAFNEQDVQTSAASKRECNSEIRKFLNFLFRQGLLDNPNLYLSLPTCAAKKERIVDVLTDEEKEKLRQYKESATTPLALRDAAVIELGLRMGFRGCDIAGLHFSNIDWKNRTICLNQQKTSVGIRLPMPNSVGNAIYRYLKDGRPSHTEDTHVFLKVRAPYGPICSNECRHALGRALPGTNGTKFHKTRRTFATALLQGGVKASSIADSLGHSSIASVHKYLALNEERMRLCPLSFEEMGLGREGALPNE